MVTGLPSQGGYGPAVKGNLGHGMPGSQLTDGFGNQGLGKAFEMAWNAKRPPDHAGISP